MIRDRRRAFSGSDQSHHDSWMKLANIEEILQVAACHLNKFRAPLFLESAASPRNDPADTSGFPH